MPTLLNSFTRLIDRLSGKQIGIDVTMDARIAHYVIPLIERLIADTLDGQTFRSSLAGWRYSERPPIRIHHAEVSTFRLEGPMHEAGDNFLPLGGLLQSPGVTAHLNPVEASELDGLIRATIEQMILQWIDRHGLQELPPAAPEINREKADPLARELIAEWLATRQALNPSTVSAANTGSDGGWNHD